MAPFPQNMKKEVRIIEVILIFIKYLLVISLFTTSIFTVPRKNRCDDYYLCNTGCCTLMMSMTQETPILPVPVLPCVSLQASLSLHMNVGRNNLRYWAG